MGNSKLGNDMRKRDGTCPAIVEIKTASFLFAEDIFIIIHRLAK